MAYVNLGELTQRVRILAPLRAVDVNGHYTTYYEEHCELRAAVRQIKAEDAMELGAERQIATVQFIVRFRYDLNSDMIIEFRNRRYQIESLDPVPFAGLYMRIRAVCYDDGTGSD